MISRHFIHITSCLLYLIIVSYVLSQSVVLPRILSTWAVAAPMALLMMITPHLKAYELHSRPLAASKKCNIVLGMRSPCHSQQRRQARACTGYIVAVALQAVPLLCWTRGRTLMPVET